MSTIWGHAPKQPLGGNPNPGMWMYGDTLARLGRLAPGVLYAGLNACNGLCSRNRQRREGEVPGRSSSSAIGIR
jgi:hypothetical protein